METNEDNKIIHNTISPISGYLISIKRNTDGGWYELEIGLPNNWVFKENEDIGCEILSETENGKLIKIFPKFDDVLIDDLIKFVNIIVETNKKIKEKEKEFQKRLEEYKAMLEKEATEHFVDIDKLRDTSFKALENAHLSSNVTNSTNDTIQPSDETEPSKRGRKPKAKLPINVVAEPQSIL
jgi:hypothetical protein